MAIDSEEGAEQQQLLFIPGPLSARDRSSFAYPTLKDRVPVIICKIIDTLYRNRGQRHKSQQEEIKLCIEGMSKLRYELQTNKPLTQIQDSLDSTQVWNDYLREETEKEGEEPRW